MKRRYCIMALIMVLIFLYSCNSSQLVQNNGNNGRVFSATIQVSGSVYDYSTSNIISNYSASITNYLYTETNANCSVTNGVYELKYINFGAEPLYLTIDSGGYISLTTNIETPGELYLSEGISNCVITNGTNIYTGRLYITNINVYIMKTN